MALATRREDEISIQWKLKVTCNTKGKREKGGEKKITGEVLNLGEPVRINHYVLSLDVEIIDPKLVVFLVVHLHY